MFDDDEIVVKAVWKVAIKTKTKSFFRSESRASWIIFVCDFTPFSWDTANAKCWCERKPPTKARQVKSSRPYKTSALSRAATISGDLISSPYPVCKSLRGRRKPRSACNATFWIFARMNFLCPSLKKDYSEKRRASIIHTSLWQRTWNANG